MSSTQGRLYHLDSTPAGATVLADTPAGAVVLAVDDAVSFAEDGGTLVLPDGTTVAYVGADLDSDTLTLAAGLPAALVEGQQVTVPGTMVHTGWVRLDGEEDVRPVRVDHAIAATLPTGPRATDDAAEPVTVTETTTGALVVIDAINRPPSVTDVDVRAQLAEYADELDAVRDQTVVAGRVVTGTLLADTSIGVLVGETDQVLIGTPAGGVAYYVPGPAEESGTPQMVPVTRMGRSYAAIDPATGEQSTVEASGVTGPVGKFERIEVAGQPLGDHIAERGAGNAVARGLFEQTMGPYTGFTGYAEVGFTAKAGRGYLVKADFRHRTNADNAYTEVRLVPSTAPAGVTPTSPLASGAPIVNRVFTNPVGTTAEGAYLERYWVASGSEDREVRMGIVFRGSSPTGSDMIEAHMVVEDAGPIVTASGRYNLMGAPASNGGTPTTPPPTAPPQERTRTWDFAWEEVYAGTGGTALRALHSTTGGNARAGTTPGGSWRYQTAWKIQHAPNAMTVAGAGNQRLQVRFYVTEAYGRTITLGLASTGTSSPNSAPSLGRSMTMTGISAGSWVEMWLPGQWVTDILAGTYDTLCLGNAPGSTSQPAIIARNVGHSTHYPRLHGAWTEQ